MGGGREWVRTGRVRGRPRARLTRAAAGIALPGIRQLRGWWIGWWTDVGGMHIHLNGFRLQARSTHVGRGAQARWLAGWLACVHCCSMHAMHATRTHKPSSSERLKPA